MKLPVLYLDENEEKAVRIFAARGTTRSVYEECGAPFCGIWPFLRRIRLKTGIDPITEPFVHAQYLERYENVMGDDHIPLSTELMRIAQMVAGQVSMRGIAHRQNLDLAQISSKSAEILNHCGIFCHDPQMQRQQLKLYLAVFDIGPFADKRLNPYHWEALRHFANDLPMPAIADAMSLRLESVKHYIGNACRMLGLNARGRNAQRHLTKAFLRYRDAQKGQITMEDPMF